MVWCWMIRITLKQRKFQNWAYWKIFCNPKDNPELYGDLYHKIRINYYPPHGDNKESWDNIDIFGWLGYKMQIKINFLCRDSILAAPIALDLALFIDLAKRAEHERYTGMVIILP